MEYTMQNTNQVDLKTKALDLLREWQSEGMRDQCYGVAELATALKCETKELFDGDYDTGVLFELSQDGHVGFTSDKSCVYANGGRYVWDN